MIPFLFLSCIIISSAKCGKVYFAMGAVTDTVLSMRCYPFPTPFPEKTKCGSLRWDGKALSLDWLLKYMATPKELSAGSGLGICVFVFRSAAFTIDNIWKQPKCPLSDEWINTVWSIHTMEHYSALQRHEILILQHEWTPKALRWVNKLDTKG